MFEQSFVEAPGKTNKTWSVLLSFSLQVLVDRYRDPDSADLHGHAAPRPADQFPDGAAATPAASSSSPACVRRRW